MVAGDAAGVSEEVGEEVAVTMLVAMVAVREVDNDVIIVPPD